ncbi:MAG: phage major tail tube protein [Alphaproteobacteria bacterium]|nr:phage major tail tube protein [Alphaproteobacteria bacterium]
MLPKLLRNFTLFVDGEGYVGKVLTLSPPLLALQTEQHLPGGFDTPVSIDVGMQPLTASFTLASLEYDMYRLFGTGSVRNLPLTMRGAIVDHTTNETSDVVIKMRGAIQSIDAGTWQRPAPTGLSFAINLIYYNLTVAGNEHVEIDVENAVRRIGGVDQLTQVRSALGLSS